MKGTPSIPDPECTRALMTGGGADISTIEARGKSRIFRVASVTAGRRRELAPEGFVPSDPILGTPPVRRDRTFGRDRTVEGAAATIRRRGGRART